MPMSAAEAEAAIRSGIAALQRGNAKQAQQLFGMPRRQCWSSSLTVMFEAITDYGGETAETGGEA